VQRHAEAVATKHNVTAIHVVTDNSLKSPEFVSVKTNNVLTKLIYLPKYNNAALKFIHFFKAYLNTIKKIKKADLVHVNITYPVGLVALYLKWVYKKKYLISEHWSGYLTPNNKSISFFQKFITKIIVQNATFVCPVSSNLKNEMKSLGFIGNYFPVPNVVNTLSFKPLKNNSKRFVITHISGMDNSIKNIVGILNTVSRIQPKLPNLEFNLIGENSKKYNPLIRKLKLRNINIIDFVAHNEIANYLNKTNVFILFSNYENLPCVILESFACGVPVVSTDVGGIKEYFPKNFGYLINPKDESKLEKSILKIYNKEKNIDKNQMHNYAKENFGIATISNTFSNLYFKILNN
jgi:glycosyltransferase involved in cell wall biosynthesis